MLWFYFIPTHQVLPHFPCWAGVVREPKYGHLKELHRAIKLCEGALVSSNPTVTSLGTYQQVRDPFLAYSGSSLPWAIAWKEHAWAVFLCHNWFVLGRLTSSLPIMENVLLFSPTLTLKLWRGFCSTACTTLFRPGRSVSFLTAGMWCLIQQR